jgi:hypothetical protein
MRHLPRAHWRRDPSGPVKRMSAIGTVLLLLAGCGTTSGSAASPTTTSTSAVSQPTTANPPAVMQITTTTTTTVPASTTTTTPVAPCTSDALVSTVMATNEAPPDIAVTAFACLSGYAEAQITTLDGDGALTQFQDVDGRWNLLFLGTAGANQVPEPIEGRLQNELGLQPDLGTGPQIV